MLIRKIAKCISNGLKHIGEKPIASYEPKVLDTAFSNEENNQAFLNKRGACIANLATADSFAESIYYITDIHLEHQLVGSFLNAKKVYESEVHVEVKNKVSELAASVVDAHGIILIGGDVADSIEIEKIFYEELNHRFKFPSWKIYAVLGNHELWDCSNADSSVIRQVDEIIDDYRQAVSNPVKLLENELFVNYEGIEKRTLSEQEISNLSVEELAEICDKSTFTILGGIGFSGLNSVYNANAGLYRETVSTEEDISRTNRFRVVYDKVLECAANCKIIVLTHMQMQDWSDAEYNSNWIYVNGHTHQNNLHFVDNGAVVFSDNQVGYSPKIWHFNCFKLDIKKYNPFEKLADGIHEISREEYFKFNRCQGISMGGMKSPGVLSVLKRDNTYMFILKNKEKLFLLQGGRKVTLERDIYYYYENLSKYACGLRAAFASYQKALSMVSDEIKAIGGWGTMHGCIVDIDRLNHVYLNPFDGKVTPYFAWDTTKKYVFENMEVLLKSSRVPPRLKSGIPMLKKYLSMSDENKLRIFSRGVDNKCALAVVPQLVLDRSMYEPSRIMRSIQYFFDQNVIRVWNDAVLDMEDVRGLTELPAKNTII